MLVNDKHLTTIWYEKKIDKVENFDADIIPITTDHFLYLSGTPFRAINTGEFIEEQIFNWTYSDEQNAKQALNISDRGYVLVTGKNKFSGSGYMQEPSSTLASEL